MSDTLVAVEPLAEDQAARTEADAFADFALGLDLASVPAAVVDLAKEHLLDVIGLALAW